MIEVDTGLFTVGVFQDVAWASKGLDALKRAGFAAESLSILARETGEVGPLIQAALGSNGKPLDIASIGAVLAAGPLVAALQGASGDLEKAGVARTMRRAGFQQHDGRIFEVLTGRGGVLVAVRSESRAADALQVLHSYGGGNAAIGAWGKRV